MTHSQSRVFIFCFFPLSSSFSAELAPPSGATRLFPWQRGSDWLTVNIVRRSVAKPLKKPPLHCSKYWTFPEPSGGESGCTGTHTALLICWHPSNETRKTAEPFPQTENPPLPIPCLACIFNAFFPSCFPKRTESHRVRTTLLWEHSILSRAWQHYITQESAGNP